MIPKPLREFFPVLDDSGVSSDSPTVDSHLQLLMYVGPEFVSQAVVRYQFQTWGGTRSAESRLTDNLGPLRNQASVDDFFILQRSLDDPRAFRAILLKKEFPEYKYLRKSIGKKRWGTLLAEAPLTSSSFREALSEIVAPIQSLEPFKVEPPKYVVSRGKRLARSTAFREVLLQQYLKKCAVSSIGLFSPQGSYEIQCAHVIPLERGGPDEPRNGLPLTSTLHWAFDRGLFGISEQRKVIVPEHVLDLDGNAWLTDFQGNEIPSAKDSGYSVADEALEWHRKNILQTAC